MSADDPSPPPALSQLGQNRPSARLLRQKVWNRMNRDNQHFMGCFVGREGSGKSHSAMAVAKTVDPSFTAERVFFEPEQLLEAFQSDEYGTGDVIMLDEAGVGLGSRSWYEKEQVLLNQVLQTVRDDNMGVLFTLPRLSELDSQTRGRLHAFVEMVELNKRDGYAVAKWKRVSPARDDRTDIYYPYPEIRVFGATRRIERVKITPPPDELVAAYEQRKEAFKQELYEEAIDAYDTDESDQAGNGVDPNDLADEVLADGVEQYVSEHGHTARPYVDKDLLRAAYGLSHADANAVKKLVEQQVDLEEKKETPA